MTKKILWKLKFYWGTHSVLSAIGFWRKNLDILFYQLQQSPLKLEWTFFDIYKKLDIPPLISWGQCNFVSFNWIILIVKFFDMLHIIICISRFYICHLSCNFFSTKMIQLLLRMRYFYTKYKISCYLNMLAPDQGNANK